MEKKSNYRFDPNGVYKEVTRNIMMSLASNVIPWKKRWTSPLSEDKYFNYHSGTVYHGIINRMLLGTPGGYMTFNQIKEEGGRLKKGAKARTIIFYNKDYVPKDKKEEAKRLEELGESWDHLKRPIYKALKVFSVEDVEDLKPKNQDNVPQHKSAENPTDIANLVIDEYSERTGVTINEKSTDSFTYDALTDEIVIPKREQFGTEEQWYNTAFAGIVKSTAKEDRCNRSAALKANLEKVESIKEELVAEIGAAMVLNGVELENKESEEDTKAECAKWMKVLENDFRLIVFAAAQADKAAKFILKPLMD